MKSEPLSLTFVRNISVFLLLSIISTSTFAVGSFKPTKAELAALPPYCKPLSLDPAIVLDYHKRPDVRKWQGIFGLKDYKHLHHYCIALNGVNRLRLVTGDQTRIQFKRDQVLQNYEFTQKHATPGFILNPEVAVKKGKILVAMGNPTAAIAEYYKAIKYKSDYATAYAALFDLYVDLKLYGDAESTIKQGLAKKPKSKMLKRRRAMFGKLKAIGAKSSGG